MFSAANAATEVRNSSRSWPRPKSKSNMLDPGFMELAFLTSDRTLEIPNSW
jgi:hypothetical protein